MPAVLLTPLFETMLDNNGVPLAGGSITSYQAGTTTPLATYTSATGLIVAPNPIPLDSAGRPSNGGVWGSGVYKFILKNSVGNQIGDPVDNVTAIYGSGDMTKATYDSANISQQVVGTTAVQKITNKMFEDSTTSFVDNADNTKAFQFELSQVSTATTRFGTVPDVSGTLALITSNNLAPKGSMRISNGFIINWGTWTSAGTTGNPVAVTFDMPFTVAVYGIYVTSIATSAAPQSAWIDSPTLTGFNGRAVVTGNNEYYFAIGK